MLAKHRTARWAKMVGWLIMPLLLIPLGALAMYWAANQGLVPGLTPPITLVKPEVMQDSFLELRHLVESASGHLRSLQADVLAHLRRLEPTKPAVVEASAPEFQRTLAPLTVAKSTPVAVQSSPVKSSAVAQPTTTKNDKEKKETQAKSVPSKAKPAEAKGKSTLQQNSQAAQPAAVALSASTVITTSSAQDIKSANRPASPKPAKTSATPPAADKNLTAAVQAKRPGLLAATTSYRTEPPTKQSSAATPPAQSSERKTEFKADHEDRTSGVTLATMMSQAINPLATGTALANSAPLSSDANRTVTEGKISQEPLQTSGQAAFPVSFPEGSLGQMAKLRAELEQLKLQVHIEEVRQRLNQLKGQTGQPQAAPSLEFPPIGLPGPATEAASEPPRSTLRLLSIQSLNGKYTATIGTSSGPRVVRVNEKVDGYRVVSISRNSVVINRGKGKETLSIYE